jgi:DNA polymerase III delta prime subunit
MSGSDASSRAAGTGAARPAPPPGRGRPIYRVFVSSTWLDLQPERRALMDALNRMEEMRFVGMEFFGNRPDDTHDASIDQVDLCELFVGIVGHRYGSGITEAEYRRARERGLPCFVYFKREDTARPELTDNDPALADRLAAFKRDLLRGHTVKEFSSPEELAANATADLHNWVAARWISIERAAPRESRPPVAPADLERTNILRLIERIEQDWIGGVLEASLHHRAWIELGLDWREDAVEHPWDRIVVAPNRPIATLQAEDSITGVFDAAQNTLLVLGEPGSGKTTTMLELARDLIARARAAAPEPAPVVLALSTWRGAHRDFAEWVVAELGLRYQVPKRLARSWIDEARLVLLLDGLDEVPTDRRAACVEAINAFEQTHHPPGIAVTSRVAEYEALEAKLRLRAAICLQPLTPAQIERYFSSAGAGLDHLRQALRQDAALRELARSPLMLSVMTMAWRDAPPAPTAGDDTGSAEARRRQLFDAYVEAAMKRRGKSTGGYSGAQTVAWLTWLARRMKEHGHTLFAVEQLQPGWIEGAHRRFGYFVATRLIGAVGLALPLLFMVPTEAKVVVAGLSLALGLFLGAVDFGFAHHGWGGRRRASVRFWIQFFGVLVLAAGWGAVGAMSGEGYVFRMIYLVMAALTFCAPVDVRALDIKPAGSMQWSWRLSVRRAVLSFALVVVAVSVMWGITFATAALGVGGSKAVQQQVAGHWLPGLVVAAVLVAIGWARIRPPWTLRNGLMAIALLLLGAQVGSNFGVARSNWEMLLFEFAAAGLMGVIAGFASTMIDPARVRQTGAWFWLRVPLAAMVVVGLVMMVPGLILLSTLHAEFNAARMAKNLWGNAAFGAGCGVIAFLRFGGFNGVQHFLLRWLLRRTGNFPPRPEKFFDHAAQLALMQKVGFGFRFVHALLLEHLVAPRATAAVPGRPSPAAESAPAEGWREANAAPRVRPFEVALRLVGWLGLVAGAAALVVVGAAMFALWRTEELRWRGWGPAIILVGVILLTLWLVLPAVILGAQWLWRRSWWCLAAGYLGLTLAVIYLATGERAPAKTFAIADVAPAFPGAEQSYRVLMRYRFGGELAKAFPHLPPYALPDPYARDRWRDFVVGNRAAFEASWAKLSPVGEWMAELNAFERIGDLSATAVREEAVAWRPVETYSRIAMGIASLQAFDGQPEAALSTLLPLYEVGAKLERAACVSEHFELARLMQHRAIAAAGVVLDTTQVPAAARSRLAAALSAGMGGPEGARRLYAIKYAETCAAFALPLGRAALAGDASLRYYGYTDNHVVFHILNASEPLLFHRHASLTLFGALQREVQELAARRQFKEVRQRTTAFRSELDRRSGPLGWNVGGAWLARQQLSARWEDSRQLRNYWSLEDRRTALLAKLAPP